MDEDRSDAKLVQAARAGNKEAFAALLARHRQLLLALCRQSLADPVLAEDAAQEAVLQAWLSLDRLRQPERFGPWLGGIGLNICRRWLRQRSRDHWSYEALAGGQMADQAADASVGPDSLIEAAELRNQVRLAVAALPRGQRSAVVLFYLLGLTYAETAELLGTEAGAVKTRLHKARSALRRQLMNPEEDTMKDKINRRTLAKTAAGVAALAAIEHGESASAAARSGSVQESIDKGEQRWVNMSVSDVQRRPPKETGPRPYLVTLAEIDGPRRLPIWVGEPEGTAIAVQLEHVQVPRPLTISFAASLLQSAGGHLVEVRINRLAGSVFYAVAIIQGAQGTQKIDARPSDALNLALLTGAPIRVEPAVLEAIATWPDCCRALADEEVEGPAEIVAELQAIWAKCAACSTPERAT